MDDDVKNSDASTPVLNTKTARPKLPEDGTERLKAYRRAKGQSGNPGGRPRKLPISDTLRLLMKKMPLPPALRDKLEESIGGQKLPKNTTFAEGLAFGELCAPFLNGFDVNHTRELREAVEGRGAYRVALPGEEPEVSADSPADCSDRIMLGLLKVVKRRQEMYNMDLPRFDAMQREAAEEMRKEDAAIAESRGHRGT
jgi:hypothetical protein